MQKLIFILIHFALNNYSKILINDLFNKKSYKLKYFCKKVNVFAKFSY